jgi:hypothetical protein
MVQSHRILKVQWKVTAVFVSIIDGKLCQGNSCAAMQVHRVSTKIAISHPEALLELKSLTMRCELKIGPLMSTSIIHEYAQLLLNPNPDSPFTQPSLLHNQAAFVGLVIE